MTISIEQLPVINAYELRSRLRRGPLEHKGHGGRVVIAGGANGMQGAILLAGRAALHLGAGWVHLQTIDDATALLHEQAELMIRQWQPRGLLQETADVYAVGPGLGQSARAYELLVEALSLPQPLILDADALNLLAVHEESMRMLQARTATTILTPHPGEAARLLGCQVADIQNERLQSLHTLVQKTNAYVVLKGHQTLVAGPQRPAQVCMQGNSGMGISGMGDVLTGILAGIIAQAKYHQLSIEEALLLAVQIHAMAADSLVQKGIGPLGLTPSEVILEARYLINVKSS